MAVGTRDRIVNAAMGLFAEKGYAATTVADIERAAGLQPRAGGMYRHFPSKVAVLAAGVRGELETLTALQSAEVVTPMLELRDLLVLFARVGLVQLDNQRSFHRILYRDLEAFPELLAEVQERLVWSSSRDLAGRLAQMHKDGLVADVDFEAVATIAVGALVNRSVIESTLGVSAPVDDDRLVDTWADMVASYLRPPAATGTRRKNLRRSGG
jgi:AcrR family transcriptional regulator